MIHVIKHCGIIGVCPAGAQQVILDDFRRAVAIIVIDEAAVAQGSCGRHTVDPVEGNIGLRADLELVIGVFHAQLDVEQVVRFEIQ